MFIRRDKLTPADTYSVRIIKGQRVGGKVKHKTILTVGTGTGEASIQKVEKEAKDIIKKLNDSKLYINRLGNISPIKNKKNNKSAPPPKQSRPPAKSTRRCSTCSERPVVAAADAPNNVGLHEVSYCHGVNNGVFDVFGQVYDKAGLNKFISGTRDDAHWNEILKALVVARIAQPDSKRETAEILFRDYRIDYPLHKYYRAMDKAAKCTRKAMDNVLKETKRLHGGTCTAKHPCVSEQNPRLQ